MQEQALDLQMHMFRFSNQVGTEGSRKRLQRKVSYTFRVSGFALRPLTYHSKASGFRVLGLRLGFKALRFRLQVYVSAPGRGGGVAKTFAA